MLHAIAIVPGLFLIYWIYKLDKIEKEPIRLLLTLFVAGMISVFPAMFLEESFSNYFLLDPSLHGAIIENFLGIALMEELVKHVGLRLVTWKNKEFDYMFDGIVYAAVTSMGFAILENIFYVTSYGLVVGIERAFLSLPGHLLYGIFMGHFYSKAKIKFIHNKPHRVFLVLSIVIPTLIHGTHDTLVSIGTLPSFIIWLIFIVNIYIFSFREVNKYSARDHELEKGL